MCAQDSLQLVVPQLVSCPFKITPDTFRSCCNSFQAVSLTDSFPNLVLLGEKQQQQQQELVNGCRVHFLCRRAARLIKAVNQTTRKCVQVEAGWRCRWRWVRAALLEVSRPQGRVGNGVQLPKITISCTAGGLVKVCCPDQQRATATLRKVQVDILTLRRYDDTAGRLQTPACVTASKC